MRHKNILAKQAQIEAELDRFRSERQPDGNELSREVREVLVHIHRNLFDSDLNVQTIKSRCRIRDNNISCRFRYEMGSTIRDYIESLRMEAARWLLERGYIGVFDVAQLVGYYHLQTFYRAFQRHFECTPAACRGRVPNITESSAEPVLSAV
jgi:two-component system, response regulator YesN